MNPIQLVEAQLQAYNLRDIDRFCAFFSDDVTVRMLKDDQIRFNGIEEFRKNYAALFRESPKLKAVLLNRMVMSDFVIDDEQVEGWRNQNVHVIAIYRITRGKISHVWYIK